MTVAESLKKIRTAHNLTQQEVASVLGLDRTAYTQYETGKTKPTIETLKKLSNMYNATIGYIVGAEKENHPERLKSAGFVSEDNPDPIALLSKDERKLLLSYRVLSEKNKEKIRKEMKQVLSEENE